MERVSPLQSLMNKEMADVLKMMLVPTYADPVRLCDGTNSATALYKSVVEFDLYVYNSATPTTTNLNFSFIAQPKLGSVTDFANYKLGIVDVTDGWPSSTAVNTAYATSINGMDPRVDPNAATLTGPPVGSYTCNCGIETTGTNGVFKFPKSTTPYPAVETVQNLNFQLIDGSPTTRGFVGPAGVFRNTLRIGAPQSWFQFVSSDWLSHGDGTVEIRITVQDATRQNVVDQIWLRAQPNLSSPYGINWTTLQEPTNAALYLDEVSINPGANASSGMFQDPALSNVLEIVFGYKNDGTYFLVPEFSIPRVNNGGQDILRYYHTIDVALYDVWLGASSNNGPCLTIRPVASSVLVSPSTATLITGGNIAIGLLPAGSGLNYYSPNNQNNLQTYEGIVNANLENCHVGNFDRGAYCGWKQYTPSEYLFLSPAQANAAVYTSIICAGNFASSSTLPIGLIKVGRINHTVVFEFTTLSRLFPILACRGTDLNRDYIKSMLLGFNLATENKTHLERVKKLLNKGISALKTGAAFATAGLGVANQVVRFGNDNWPYIADLISQIQAFAI